MNKDFGNDNELFDALAEYFRFLPKATVKVINPQRYIEMMAAATELQMLLEKTMPEGEMEIDFDTDTNLGAISVETDILSVTNIKQFVEIISKADNFEIYPLANGRLRLDITFHSILKAVC